MCSFFSPLNRKLTEFFACLDRRDTDATMHTRVRHLEQELDDEIRVELGDSDMSDKVQFQGRR